MPSPVRTVIAADFDNDQELEVFFNNIAYRGSSANRLFRWVRATWPPEARVVGSLSCLALDTATTVSQQSLVEIILSFKSSACKLKTWDEIAGRGNSWSIVQWHLLPWVIIHRSEMVPAEWKGPRSVPATLYTVDNVVTISLLIQQSVLPRPIPGDSGFH